MLYNILAVLIPIYITISGLFMKFKPDSDVTAVIGYNGRVVAKTREMKQEAYKKCGGKWIIAGIGLLILSFALVYMAPQSWKSLAFAVCIILQLAFMIGTIVIVEIYFIKKYGRDIYGR